MNNNNKIDAVHVKTEEKIRYINANMMPLAPEASEVFNDLCTCFDILKEIKDKTEF